VSSAIVDKIIETFMYLVNMAVIRYAKGRRYDEL
jgi:hypothetical protein